MKIKRLDEFNSDKISENKQQSNELANDIAKHYKSKGFDTKVSNIEDGVAVRFYDIHLGSDKYVKVVYKLIDDSNSDGVIVRPYVTYRDDMKKMKHFPHRSLRDTKAHINDVIALLSNLDDLSKLKK